MSAQQSRVQSGIPTGGEFAPSAKPAAGVALDATRTFQDPVTGSYHSTDGADGLSCPECGNGYRTAAALAEHDCEGADGDGDGDEDEEMAVEDALEAELRAIRVAASKVDGLVLKKLALGLRRTHPDATHIEVWSPELVPNGYTARGLLGADGDYLKDASGQYLQIGDELQAELDGQLRMMTPAALADREGTVDTGAEARMARPGLQYRIDLSTAAQAYVPDPTVPSPDSTMYFSAAAVRDHFEADEPDPLAGLSDEDIAEIGRRACQDDVMWEAFHRSLYDAMHQARAAKGLEAI